MNNNEFKYIELQANTYMQTNTVQDEGVCCTKMK